MKKTNMQHFALYAANMQQNAAAVAFLGKLEINYFFYYLESQMTIFRPFYAIFNE